MKKFNLGQTLNTLANFGVILGIIFLAIELRQNQSLMEREFDLQVVDGLKLIADSENDLSIMRIESREVAQIWLDGQAGRELDPVDVLRWNSMCSMSVWNQAVLYERNRVLGETEITRAMAYAVRETRESAPAMDACWSGQEAGLRGWGLGDILDAASAPDSQEQ